MENKTPIQQAIEYVETQMKKWRPDDSIDRPIYTAYGIVRDRLVIMLRDEKDFCESIWTAAEKYTREDDRSIHGHEFENLSKVEFFNKLYPKK